MIFRILILVSTLLLIIETKFDFIQFSIFSQSESSLIEIIQLLIITLAIIINLKYKKIFIKNGIKLSYYLRLGTLAFLFYEEISFLTKGMIYFFNKSNYQKEVNIHNLVLLQKKIGLNIPIFDISISLTYQIILFSLALIFIAYGNIIPFLKNLNLFFLERKYSIYFLTYFFIELINSVYISSLKYPRENPIIHHEFLELLIYMIFLADTYSKFKKFNPKSENP